MTKQLTVHNAEVRTAAVEVRSLTISGKQVTLAVFRQLQEESPLTDLNEWKGVPWGFVNYLNDDPDSKRHVVWQKGSELRRGFVTDSVSTINVYGGELADDWLAAAVDGGWRSTSWNEQYGKFNQSRTNWIAANGSDKPVPEHFFRWGTSWDAAHHWNKDCRVGGFGTNENWVIEANYDDQATQCVNFPDPQRTTGRFVARDRFAAKAAIDDVIADVEANRERKRQRWQETLALDQLFIAV